MWSAGSTPVERAFCAATFWALQRWGKVHSRLTGTTVGIIARGRRRLQYYTRCIYGHSVWPKRDASNLAVSAGP